MSETTFEIRFIPRSEEARARFTQVMSGIDTANDWVFPVFPTTLESIGNATALRAGLSGRLREDPSGLYYYTAAYATYAPVMRIHFSATGNSIFLTYTEGSLQESSIEKPLDGLSIVVSGGWLPDFDELEFDGATCSETVLPDSDLLVFGANGDPAIKAQAEAAGIRVLDEQAFGEIHAGWIKHPLDAPNVELDPALAERVRGIDSFPAFAEFMHSFDVSAMTKGPGELPQGFADWLRSLFRR